MPAGETLEHCARGWLKVLVGQVLDSGGSCNGEVDSARALIEQPAGETASPGARARVIVNSCQGPSGVYSHPRAAALTAFQQPSEAQLLVRRHHGSPADGEGGGHRALGWE